MHLYEKMTCKHDLASQWYKYFASNTKRSGNSDQMYGKLICQWIYYFIIRFKNIFCLMFVFSYMFWWGLLHKLIIEIWFIWRPSYTSQPYYKQLFRWNQYFWLKEIIITMCHFLCRKKCEHVDAYQYKYVRFIRVLCPK